MTLWDNSINLLTSFHSLNHNRTDSQFRLTGYRSKMGTVRWNGVADAGNEVTTGLFQTSIGGYCTRDTLTSGVEVPTNSVPYPSVIFRATLLSRPTDGKREERGQYRYPRIYGGRMVLTRQFLAHLCHSGKITGMDTQMEPGDGESVFIG